MRRTFVVALAIALASTSCISGGARTRTVLVDYGHDQFTSFFAHDFPDKVQVAPGDTVVFRQTWTGEPHTVTGGTIVDGIMRKATLWLPFFKSYDGLRAEGVGLPDTNGDISAMPESITTADVIEMVRRSKPSADRTTFLDLYPQLVKSGAPLPEESKAAATPFKKVVSDVDEATSKLFEGVPFAFGDSPADINQNVGQRCFLPRGGPPKKPDEPCAKRRQRQPLFDGKASFYNSGIIPYQGPQGNTYKVQLSPTIKPGNYFFYCAVHGPFQSAEITVRKKGASIPSQEAVSRQASREVRELAAPLLKLLRDSRDGTVRVNGTELHTPFAGLGDNSTEGAINEFIPKRITTKVDQPVTWTILGSSHSISFNVPKYFPIMRFAKSGKITANPGLFRPVGSPKIPESKDGEITRVDGGTYDGRSEFFSSSLFGGDPYATYTLRVSKPGTYTYACLVHPAMIGTLVVTR